MLKKIGHLIPYPKRKVEFHHFLQQKPWLCVGPIDHGCVRPGLPLLLISLQLTQNIDTLLLLIFKSKHPDRKSLPAPGLNLFWKTHLVMDDDSACRLHNRFRRAEVII